MLSSSQEDPAATSPMDVDGQEGGSSPEQQKEQAPVEETTDTQIDDTQAGEAPLEELEVDMDFVPPQDPDPEMPVPEGTDPGGVQMMTVNGVEIPVFDGAGAVDSGAPVPVIPGLGARRDKSLKEFLGMMEEFAPIIPDAVTDYYLMKAGFESSDIRMCVNVSSLICRFKTNDRDRKRLLALATQKFVSDIATDAYQYSRIRSAWSAGSGSSNPAAAPGQFRAGMPPRFGGGGGVGGAAGGGAAGGGGSGSGKVVLTMEDLSSALAEYGVNVHRPEFYR
ncbi:transcription initiation factor TFIID 23-30kDa subunit-domain-containing protein [Lipomyces orientalis]|uniref:Transcription initiation factor TFIID 23-30kDa subunit-domain-containing protein n=1 Tax=Lipomyces orientalis TaxID=1233043 RepID=A0ACC3TV39_9ASCO